MMVSEALVAKTPVKDKRVHRWLRRWYAMDKQNKRRREQWLKLFHGADLAEVSADVRSQLELVGQFNRRTMPKDKGGEE